ncbi:Cdc6/Cdc18 family protein [Natrinema thermotolerans]|uniref:Cdc6/Cdc18 family protein n=1 Tax=Natrinema thermotolerans TaxID=121872 RepID=UPI000A068A31|nr:AAA family ATPase [Natrinema thermotolerans]QCC57332.1 AAA family ATPase [Natrinema thermotolerans]
MIESRWVFSDDRLPDTLHHRRDERDKLLRAFEPLTSDNRAEDVLISGPSGVGKTTTVRHVLRRGLRDHGFDSAIVNSSNTRSEILHEAAVKHPTDTAVRAQAPAENLTSTLGQIADRPYVVVLDEADTIRNLEVVRDLLDVPKVSVVAIAHNPREWLARLDGEVQNYFSMRSQVAFERYSQDELVDILEPRVEQGLEYGAIRDEDDYLSWIADEVAGVARYGIKSLLSAAEFAEERDHDYLHERDVRDSFERARQKMRKANLRSLPFGPCLIYELLRYAADDLVEGARLHSLYETHAPAAYADRDHEPVSRRRINDYLTKLVEYGLIEQHGENRWAEYEVIDTELGAPVQLELPINA